MSDDRTVDTGSIRDTDASGAPPEPRAARRRTHDPLNVVVAILLVVVLLAGVAVGAWWANGRWGRRAMVVTGISAIEALIEGDADGLAAVSNDAVRAQLDASTRTAMRNSGILVEFTGPEWIGDTATIRTEGGMGSGVLVAGPSPDGRNVVTYRTMGAIGFTNGAVALERTSSGWVVTGLAVKASDLPTSSAPATGSAEPTATP